MWLRWLFGLGTLLAVDNWTEKETPKEAEDKTRLWTWVFILGTAAVSMFLGYRLGKK